MVKRSIWKLLGKYISGESIPDKSKIESWISEEPARQHILKDLSQFVKMVELEKTDNTDQHSWEILQSRIQKPQTIGSDEQLHKSRRLFPISYTLRIAAAITLLIAVGGTLFYFVSPKSKKDQIVVSTTATEFKKRIKLPDGTIVWLNKNSKIKYPASFKGLKRREVCFIGEGFFDVTHNPDQPFVVNTSSFKIEVLGTIFNVRSYPDDDKQVATLVEGSIKLKTKGVIESKEEEILLTPNQQVTYCKSNQELKLDVVEADNAASWMLFKYKFKNESFYEISNKLAAAYNVKFHFTDTSLKDLNFTGTLKRTDSISQIMSVIKAGFPITYQIIGDSIVIRPK